MDLDLGDLRLLAARGRCLTVLEAGARIGRDEGRPVEERVEGLLLACQAANRLELFSRQADLARQALELAANPGGAARATLALGVAAVRLGDPYEGERHLLSALAAPLPEHGKAAAQYNLGRAYEQMRRYEPALTCYAEAARLFGPEYPALAVMAHQQAAWVHLISCDPAPAYRHLSAAADLLHGLTAGETSEATSGLSAGDTARRQADQLALEAFARRLAGQTAEAVRLAEELIQPGYPGATDWTRCFVLWLSADVAAEEGRNDLARELLDQAYRFAEGARDPGLWNRLGNLKRALALDG